MKGRICLITVATAALALYLAGCGGGGADGPVGTASIQGTVYMPDVTSTEVTTAARPASYCQVNVTQTRTRQRLGSTETDQAGRFQFRGLRAGEDVEIWAEMPGGERLRKRLQLRDGTCQADIDAGTTLAAMAADAVGDPASADGIGDIVGQICEQFQAGNQYQYRRGQGQGRGPNWSDGDEVAQTAEDLLVAATEAQVQRALQTRAQGDCEGAVAMVMARLRQQQRLELNWDDETRNRVAEALQQRYQMRAEWAAEAMSEAIGSAVTTAEVEQMREQFRAQIRAFKGEDMEACEALGAMCMGDGEQLRLRTREQVRECVRQLTGQ